MSDPIFIHFRRSIQTVHSFYVTPFYCKIDRTDLNTVMLHDVSKLWFNSAITTMARSAPFSWQLCLRRDADQP